jgi:subtilisin family serine protease
MVRLLLIAVMGVWTFLFAGNVSTLHPAKKMKAESVEGRILVKFKGVDKIKPPKSSGPMGVASEVYEKMLPQKAVNVLNKIQGKVVWMSSHSKISLVKIPKGNVGKAIETLYREGVVEYAEPDYKVKALATTPNDPDFDKLWGLNNSNDADIDAPEAWDKTTDGSKIIVGVIDTGVDYNHEDLKNNMWKNPNEIPDNDKDDDDNGWVDDVYGVDFYNNDSDPMDDHGHGSHCSGTIGAEGNNSIGVVGVNWKAKIMALKFLSSYGSGSTSDAIRAMDYYMDILEDNNITKGILSNSWGGYYYSKALYDEIKELMRHNVLFIAAAGNDGLNTDVTPMYPAAYNLPNIISVGASNSNDEMAWFSNYGSFSVDLFAPGVDILSTTPGDNYEYYSGTSMATPHVAGAAALIWSKYPKLSWAKVKGKILNGVDKIQAFYGKSVTGGRLNVNKALLMNPNRPAIFSVFPIIANRGDKITITGVNFGKDEGKVLFGNKELTILSWKPGKIEVQIPKNTPYVERFIKVKNAKGLISTPVYFRVASIATKVGETIIPHAWASYVQMGNKVYIFGGGTYWGQTGIVERCTLQQKPRCVIDSNWMMPTPLTNTSAIAISDDEIAVVGGFDWNTYEVSDKIQIFDTSKNAWEDVNVTLPVALISPSLFTYDGKLYVVGGQKEDFTINDKTYVYDPSNDTWSEKSAPLVATVKSVVGKIDTDKFLVAGGATSGSCSDKTNIVQIYDAANDEWSYADKNMTKARLGAGSFTVNNQVYALMGNCYGDDSGEKFIPSKEKWINFIAFPEYLYTPAAGYRGGYGYTLSGFNYIEGYSRNIYRFKR